MLAGLQQQLGNVLNLNSVLILDLKVCLVCAHSLALAEGLAGRRIFHVQCVNNFTTEIMYVSSKLRGA